MCKHEIVEIITVPTMSDGWAEWHSKKARCMNEDCGEIMELEEIPSGAEIIED